MKERLDVLLVKRALAPSREKAKAMIMEGSVYVNNQKEDKAGSMFDTGAQVEVRGKTLRYASRGGLKLEKAMERFAVSLEQKTCMDIGASTGGFTDCMLQNGARKVYAVDVGYGQLAWKLRQDVLGPAKELLKEQGEMVCLIKPQFEAGREKVGKKGVVRDKNVHLEVIGQVVSFARGLGFHVLGLEYSPIKGPEGNIEYLMHIRKDGTGLQEEAADAAAVVEAAHAELDI